MDNPLPEYWYLLREAFQAGEVADNYDVHSDDPESAAKFDKLLTISERASLMLVQHITAHAEFFADYFSGKTKI